MSATSGRTAGRIGRFISSQLAGIALALLMVQHSAARGSSPRAE